MATVFVIDNTAGTLSFSIQPGALNGPGGAQRNSDLRLYGLGALNWGEGVDENFYRIAENFSCPQKETGDYNPVTGNFDYNDVSDPILPQDENDLGPGKGITIPLNGQMWFNTTRKLFYVYDDSLVGGAGWRQLLGGLASDSAPLDPQTGDLWYDTSVSPDAVGCITDPVLKIYNPSHPSAQPDGWVLAGEDFVRQCGDYMTGDLSMAGPGSPLGTRNRITNLGDPVDTFDAAHKQYADAISTSLTSHVGDDSLHLTSDQNTFLDGLDLPTLTADQVNSLTNLPPATDLSAELDRTLKIDVDPVADSENIMDTGKTIQLGRHPGPTDDPLTAATKQYVEDEVSAAGSGQGFLINRDLNPGTEKTGDVKQVGATIQMYLTGTGWVTIYPAQYVP